MPYDVVKTGQDKGYVMNTKTGKTYSDSPIPLYKAKRQERILKEKADDDPCWSGYEMIGMKTKRGRRVPNCVPKKE
jgi:hypothetical protein